MLTIYNVHVGVCPHAYTQTQTRQNVLEGLLCSTQEEQVLVQGLQKLEGGNRVLTLLKPWQG